ncbi:C-5 cytosine-specific DNA methylase [Popillia japonica]|uniref:DNA (cytosine-5-)-methyltransferase n=1 Tax=Popillia japonica TaxID=7064 RepID=A0AAW1IXR3_POPJA
MKASEKSHNTPESENSKFLYLGIVVNHKDLNFKASNSYTAWIFWFGDYRVSKVKHKDLCHFGQHFHRFYERKRRSVSHNWHKGVLEAIKEYGSPDTSEYNQEELICYAEKEFRGNSGHKTSITKFVLEKLRSIRDKNQENNVDEDSKVGASNEVKEMLDLIINESKSKEDICLACYSTDVVDYHPLFEGSICINCKNKLKRTYFVFGDDNIKYFCAVCACLGNMVVCSRRGCGLVYCSHCLDDLCSPIIRRNIIKQDPWLCFICNPSAEYPNSLIKSRYDWKDKIQILFSQNSPISNRPSIPELKKPIRVLSLFDGIGTGLTALSKLNITVECYYSCEIDYNSIAVAKKNYPGGITLLGDVRSLTEENIKSILPIDLLLGGSPCNDLSLANPYRKGLYDIEGTGVLFFEFYRILTNIQMYNSRSFFWLYENVASMSVQSKVSITRFLQCEPQYIDAAWVSSQSRPRLFWGNLPSLQDQLFIEDGPNLQHYLLPGRKAAVEKLRTVTTKRSEMRCAVFTSSNSEETNIDIIELEEIFGFPRNYTKVEDLTKNTRQQLLGRAWSVQTICMLFRCLQDYFKQYE